MTSAPDLLDQFLTTRKIQRQADAEDALYEYQLRRRHFDQRHPDCEVDEAVADLYLLGQMLPPILHDELWRCTDAPARRAIEQMRGATIRRQHDRVRDILEDGLRHIAGLSSC